MHKLRLAAALGAATLSTAAIAADWVSVAESTTGTSLYVDRESIRTMPSGYKRAWVKNFYGTPNSSGDTGSTTLREFDCREGRTRTLQWAFFKGEEVTTTSNDPNEWSYVAPDSLAEGMFDYVCFGKLD